MLVVAPGQWHIPECFVPKTEYFADMPDQQKFPGFEEIKNLPDNDVPYVNSLILPEATGQHRFMKLGEISVSDGQLYIIDPRLKGQTLRHFNDAPIVEMNFTLEGRTLQQQSYLKEELEFVKGYHNLMYNAGQWEQNRFVGDGAHNTFTIHMTTDRFAQLFAPYYPHIVENLQAERPFLIQQPAVHYTPQMLSVIHAIWNSTLQGNMKKLFLETKMMELMMLQNELFTPRITKTDILKSRDDIDRIYLAREIILKEMQNPPTLSQLARRCGLNEFKLKKGFKQIFNNTVFGYLNITRLEHAKMMLLDNQLTLSEIAFETGYAHLQHFSRAFKKHFGVTPGSLTR
ncbi:AraC family transcriptional regulator [Chitinophaga sp.]|uniref:helix-turn-helix transcriptional regulator n=1 Tax=Chitinophaga sp. TaxID=1869181 RepID=UPI0031DE614F